jgi:hypothetical protein
MRTNCLMIFIAVIVTTCFAQAPFDPRNPPIICETEEQSAITSIDDATGRVKVLWIVCTADSQALPQSWPLGSGAGHRVCNPVTYQMPSWASWVFDSSRLNSLSSYYLDQSGGRFGLTGKVVGRDSLTVFKCDPDTAVRPRHDNQSGGTAFFYNIMAKVDSFVNLTEYLPTPTATEIPFMIFDIYALAESCRVEAGGQWPMTASYTFQQVNSLGQHIHVSATNGVVCWSVAEQTHSNSFCNGWSLSDSVKAAYWPNLIIAAHEMGHHLGGLHGHSFCDCNYVDQSPGSHLGCGAFDPMSLGVSFTDPDNGYVAGEVCPYNPYWRNDLGWMTVVNVDHPLLNYVMTDHVLRSSDICLKIPTYRTDETSNQYFLAAAVTRNSPWDRLWPANGLMIMHGNPGQSQNDRHHKRFDMELASGQYTWIDRWERSNPSWGCFQHGDTTRPCSLSTGENTLVRNTVTGLDSFDFVWVHNPQTTWPTLMYCGLNDELHPAGTGATFFQTGQVFSDTSNPSAAAQRDNSPWAQDLPTMANINVLAIDPFTHTITVNAWSRHWSGTVSTDALWLDSVVVDANLTVSSGATITIQSGTKVTFANNADLIVYGRLIANGGINDTIKIRSAQGATSGGGVYLNDAVSSRISYCDFGAVGSHGIYVGGGTETQIYNCRMHGTGIGLDVADVDESAGTGLTCTNNLIDHCTLYGIRGGISSGTFLNNEIDSCGRAGIYWVGDYHEALDNRCRFC